MLKLASRNEGRWIFKAIEYRTTDITRFENLVQAMATELKVPKISLLKLIYRLEKR